MKSFSTVCTIVITVNLCLVWSVSFESERTFGNDKFTFNKITGTQGTNLTCPMNPVCSLTSIRCKSNADCYPAMPVCCAAQGIRCCNLASTAETGQPICPGNNPPPACRNAEVCTADNQCSGGERCCRTYFGGRLLNFSCCINATRGPQCPPTVAQATCVEQPNAGICGGTTECPAGQICCAVGTSATVRCCVFPACPAIITAENQCDNNGGDSVSACDVACLPGQICCYPGTVASPCCAVNPTVG